jgi:hypothetical protein
VARGACLTFRKISTCFWTHPRLTRTNRGALWQNSGSKRRAFSESDGKPWFKEAFNEIELVISSFARNFSEGLIQSLLIGLSIPLYLLLSPVASVLLMFSKIRCIGFTSWRTKFLGFTRSTLASHICSTDSIPWVHHSRDEGSLGYDRRLVRLQVYLEFNIIIHRQQDPFSDAVAGEQVIKIRSFIAFCVIFSFRLVFIFASTNFWSSSKLI